MGAELKTWEEPKLEPWEATRDELDAALDRVDGKYYNDFMIPAGDRAMSSTATLKVIADLAKLQSCHRMARLQEMIEWAAKREAD